MQRISVQYAAVPVPTLGPGDLGIVSAACRLGSVFGVSLLLFYPILLLFLEL